MKQPIFNNNIFRDIKAESLDFDKNKHFIITRVLEYWSRGDFLLLVQLYGKENLRKDIILLKNLSLKTINFLCFYFDLDRNNFICYTKTQSAIVWWKH